MAGGAKIEAAYANGERAGRLAALNAIARLILDEGCRQELMSYMHALALDYDLINELIVLLLASQEGLRKAAERRRR